MLRIYQSVITVDGRKNPPPLRERILVEANLLKLLRPGAKVPPEINRNLLNVINKNTNTRKRANRPNLNAKVTTWMNKSMMGANKNNVTKNRRVFLATNVNKNGNVKTVYNKNGILNWLTTANSVGTRATKNRPLTKKPYKTKNIKKYHNKVPIKNKVGMKKGTAF